MRTLLVARHGESEFSLKRLVNGDPTVACPLTGSGRSQARALAQSLAGRTIDLCAVTEFERVRKTAERALEGRDVALLVVPDLNDPRYGEFEGGSLATYREWVRDRGPLEAPPGGEHRAGLATRYARGFRTLLARPEETILLVAHSLPIAYLRDAAAGSAPRSRTEQVEYAELLELDRHALDGASRLLADWAAAPVF